MKTRYTLFLLQLLLLVISTQFRLSSLSNIEIALNQPQVLLPANPESGVRANFTLKAVDGCFTWKSTRPEVASVQPLYLLQDKPQCSRHGVVTSETDAITRLSAVVLAEELISGHLLRCDILIDSIQRIAIKTTTRELLVEEAPEEFQILAYDQEGNVFSSLGGLKFHWSIHLDDENRMQKFAPESIITFVKFADSNYEADDVIKDLESRGSRGDRILIQGLQTGTAIVSARLVESFPVDTPTPEDAVRVLVMENIMLFPSSDVYILPLSYVDYVVERRKYGRMEILSVPSEQYKFIVANDTVGYIHRDLPRFTGVQLGQTDVILRDANMAGLGGPHSTRGPSAGVHVVLPARMDWFVSPGGVWVLERTRRYQMSVELFDRLKHTILLQDDVKLDTVMDTSHFTIHYESENSSYFEVTPIKIGVTKLRSSLEEITVINMLGDKEPLQIGLTKLQEVTIYEPIAIIPSILCLLWDLGSNRTYHGFLAAEGGSGEYYWSIGETNIASISQIGKVIGLTEGRTVAKVNDRMNNLHFATAPVFVVPPDVISFLPSQVEIEIGSEVILPLKVQADVIVESKHLMIEFNDCRHIPLDIATSSEEVFILSIAKSIELTDLPESSCIGIRAVATSVGHTKLTVTYKGMGRFITASVTIAAYPPLQVIDPQVGVAVVTLASSWTYKFEGGPQPWVLDPSSYVESLESEAREDIRIIQNKVYEHEYVILCLKLNEQQLTLSIYNRPSAKNPLPARVSLTVSFACATPVSMQLITLPHPPPSCPLLQSQGSVPSFAVQRGRMVDVEVSVFDDENRRFDNFSSIDWHWTSSNIQALTVVGDRIIQNHRLNTLSCQLSDESLDTQLYARAEEYLFEHLHIISKSREQIVPPLYHTVFLLARTTLSLSPDSVNIYNYELNTVFLNITEGSGHFLLKTFQPNPLQLIEATHLPAVSAVQIVPLNEGYTTLIAEDLCLVPSPGGEAHLARANILVSGIYAVEIQTVDKVQIGDSILGLVRVLDSSHNPFPSSQHIHMSLTLSIRRDILSVTPASSTHKHSLLLSQLSHNSVYHITGKSVGFTNIAFNTTTKSGSVISSRPTEIQVFPPLALNPKLIILLQGCVFQIIANGGPRPYASVQYSNEDDVIATVDAGGLISSHVIGETLVVGRSQALDPVSGRIVVFSEDSVRVRVVKLTGVSIFIAQKFLVEGSDVSVRAQGYEDDFLFYFSDPFQGLLFHWWVTNSDAVEVRSVYSDSGVFLEEERTFVGRIIAKSVGASTLHLKVECRPGLCQPDGSIFHDQLRIQVVPKLTLLFPSASGSLLLPQNGYTRVKTNIDTDSHLSYALVTPCQDISDDKQLTHVIRLSDRGEIHTGSSTGNDVILITSQDSGLNQTISVYVEVKNIEGITLRPESHISALKNSSVHAYPLGFRAKFKAVLQDNLGRDFAPAQIPLNLNLNRLDVLEFSSIDTNSSLTIRPIKQGYAILKVCVKNLPHICDYLHLRGDYAILPSHPHIHVGSRVEFSLYLIDENGDWTTGNEAIISLSPSSGKGITKASGHTTISHRISGLGETAMDVWVHKVDHIVLGEISHDVITNAITTSPYPYSLPVEFYHSEGANVFTPIPTEIGFIQQMNLSCTFYTSTGVTDLDVNFPPFSISSKFDSETNEYSCELTPSSDPQSQIIWANSEHFSVQLSMYATVEQTGMYTFVSNQKSIQITPAFYLTESFITLSPLNQKVSITIIANEKHATHLRTQSEEDLISSHIQSSGNNIILTISLIKIDTQSFTTHVTLSSSLSAQTAILSIFYNNSLSALPTSSRPISGQSDFLGENIIGIFIGIVLGMAAILMFLGCQGNFPLSGGGYTHGGFQQTLPPVPSPGNFSPLHTSFQRSPQTSPMPTRRSATTISTHTPTFTSPGASFRSRSAINLYSQSAN
ncbi:Nuclear pore membrane glycoprotein [Oopsacas minuta]|uniref:Nuclear pore membrane glycoprotein n=1 Tax=Oopsacas minuta TaxID=111878 RepID=A0AAV7JEY5_9METZ|nr:Nuclear pore membrane glycoprotein [Oopsacas minuta]